MNKKIFLGGVIVLLGVIIFLKLEFNTDDITSVEVPVIVDDKNVPKKEVLVTPILEQKKKRSLKIRLIKRQIYQKIP